MRNVAINLRDPFEESLERALALPAGAESAVIDDRRLTAALRRVYEFAHGRLVLTTIGPVEVASATVPALADTTFYVATGRELLTATGQTIAFARPVAASDNGQRTTGSALREFID